MSFPDLSIIVTSNRPTYLAHLLGYLGRQSLAGISHEVVIVQEADDFTPFAFCQPSARHRIVRQKPHLDKGAAAKDRGLVECAGEFVVFWDDDNIYYPHAAISLFLTAYRHDIGIVRTRHLDLVIPTGEQIKAGDIDCMCLCVRRSIATRVKWADRGGRYSDFRWISKVVQFTKSINYSPVVIGEHLV